MSRLAELLKSRGTPANLSTQSGRDSQHSQHSQGGHAKNALTPDLARRIRAMAQRWQYAPDELQDALQRAALDPPGWLAFVCYDESREAEHRATGALPAVNA